MGTNNLDDSSSAMRYNVDTYDDYEAVVKMDEQKPINDTDCTHDTLVPDPADTLGDAVYHGCANPKCGRGWYILR